MKAAFLIRNRLGELIGMSQAIPVDPVSALAESRRLREFYGPDVEIDSSQIVRARTAMRQRDLLPA